MATADAFVKCGAHLVTDGHYDVDVCSLEKMMDELEIQILENQPDFLQFRISNAHISLPNALRRIIMNEVPSMAIERCDIFQNTGVIQDEILCHRIGLIPFKVDPMKFTDSADSDELSSSNSLVFTLQAVCPQNTKILPIYSSHIKWMPRSEVEFEAFKDCPPQPVHDDILITKLGPGQEIDMTMYLQKGIGATHAKWSPAACVFFSLEDVLRLKKNSDGSFLQLSNEELSKLDNMVEFDFTKGIATIVRNRAYYRLAAERLPDKLEYVKNKNKIIFTIEGVGSIRTDTILRQAVKVLAGKVKKITNRIRTIRQNTHNTF